MRKLITVIIEFILELIRRDTPENKAKQEKRNYVKQRKKLCKDIQNALDNADVDLLRKLRL